MPGGVAMKIRFKMGWRGYREGQCLDFDDGVANVLIARGIVELQSVPVPGPAVQTMVPPQSVEVTITNPAQRPKRRG